MAATTALNLYQSIVATPAATSSSSTTTATSDSDAGQSFSDMVDASNDRASAARSRDASSDSSKSTSANKSTSSSSTSSATDETSDTTDTLSILNHEVTPEEANDLLGKFDQLSAQLTQEGVSTAQQAQLKGKLETIADTGVSDSVSDILASLSLSSTLTADAADDAKPALGSIASALKKNVAKSSSSKDDQTATAQPATPSASPNPNTLTPILVSLQAAASTDTTPDTKDQTVTSITPLSANLTLVAANDAGSAPTDAVEETTQSPTIDTLVPALTPPPKSQVALPSVTLPSTNAPATAVDQSSTSPAANASQSLQNAIAADGQTITKAVKENDDTPVAKTNGTDAINAINGTPGLTGTVTTNAIAPTTAVNTHNAVNNAPVAEQVAVAVTRAASDGINHITIQLSPEGLGRVEVKMQISHDGLAQMQFTADKPETFDALSRDARSLEKSLQESGIKADTSSMQFNLRQQPQPHADLSGGNNGRSQQQAEQTVPTRSSSTTTSVAALTKNYTLNIRDGVDIHA